MKLNALLLLSLTVFCMPVFAESYLCTAEVVSGISYESKSKSWGTKSFKPYQVLLKPLNHTDRREDSEYGIYGVGDGSLLFACHVWFEEVGVARCGNTSDYHFIFMRNDNKPKFTMADLGWDYVSQNKNATPNIAAGNCVSLN